MYIVEQRLDHDMQHLKCSSVFIFGIQELDISLSSAQKSFYQSIPAKIKQK